MNIEIEDHNGHLHAGEMRFYDSASCLHGLHGRHYSSTFVQYQPADHAIRNFTIEDVVEKIPSFWNEGVSKEIGSRFANVVCSTDSCVTEGAPPRIVDGVLVEDMREHYHRVLPGHVDKIYSIESSVYSDDSIKKRENEKRKLF